jgi:hypothetical protein
MPHPAAELENAILAALEPLAGRLSGVPPRGAAYPQLGLCRTAVHDWMSGVETGEHLLTVHVWSKAGGSETEGLSEKIRARLAGGLDLGGGRVAKMRLEFEETRHEAEFSVYHGLLRFRARIENGS